MGWLVYASTLLLNSAADNPTPMSWDGNCSSGLPCGALVGTVGGADGAAARAGVKRTRAELLLS